MSHASHPMSSRNRNRYYYLFFNIVYSFVCVLVYLCACVLVCSCVRSRALTIPFEVRAVQDVIHLLMNHVPTSNHLSGPILLDHLELRLDLLSLDFVTKPTAYW